MKLIIASDIHGSSHYCGKLVENYHKEKADRILLLGDVLYHGPRNELPNGYNPKEVIAQLNSLSKNIICVKGNCEAQVDEMVLDFPIMCEHIQIILDGIEIFATHGHLYGESNPPKIERKYILMSGHTHVSRLAEYERFVYINPGSVSIPKEGTPRGFILYEDKTFVWKDIEGEEYRRYKIT